MIFCGFRSVAVNSVYKFLICNRGDGQEGRTASSCQISSKSVKPRPRYGYFEIFQDDGTTILDF